MKIGFFALLFDLSFSDFITPKLIRVLYAIGIFGSGIVSLSFILGAFKQNTFLGVLALVFLPVLFLLGVLYVRVLLELAMVIFQAESHLRKLTEQLSQPKE